MQHSGLAIEQLSVRSLKPYPRNARRHSKDQIKQIAASITRFGFNNPILIADDGEIVAGHGRLAAAKLLGLETVPTLRLSHLGEAERRAYAYGMRDIRQPRRRMGAEGERSVTPGPVRCPCAWYTSR